MTKVNQDIPQEKKENMDDMQMEVETQPPVGCKIRILVGYENAKTLATITSSKKEVDFQFCYPGRNKLIKGYKHIKDNYSWDDEY